MHFCVCVYKHLKLLCLVVHFFIYPFLAYDCILTIYALHIRSHNSPLLTGCWLLHLLLSEFSVWCYLTPMVPCAINERQKKEKSPVLHHRNILCWCVECIYLHHITKPALIWFRIRSCELDISSWIKSIMDEIMCTPLAICGRLIKMTISHTCGYARFARVLRSILMPFHHHSVLDMPCLWLPFSGLLITYVALNLMDGHGQPALLYIVPFTIGKWCLPLTIVSIYVCRSISCHVFWIGSCFFVLFYCFVCFNKIPNLCRHLLSTGHEERRAQKPVDKRTARESVHAHAPIPQGFACCGQLAVVDKANDLTWCCLAPENVADDQKKFPGLMKESTDL